MLALRLPAHWLLQGWHAAQRWPPYRQRWLPLAAFLTALLALAPWLLAPSWQSWQQQRQQTEALRAQNHELAMRLQRLRRQAPTQRQAAQDHARVLRALAREDATELLHALEALRAAHDLRQDSYEPLPATQLACCEARAYRLSLSGRYADLRAWLEDLQQLPQLLLIEQMHWQLQDEGHGAALHLSLVLRHYQALAAKSP